MTDDKSIWIVNGPIGVKQNRLILVNDAHGRIIIANGSTPSFKMNYQYIPAPDCMHLRIYVTEVLSNIRELNRTDEQENTRAFDRQLRILQEIETTMKNLEAAIPITSERS
jgi:hypothetical protein